MRTLHRMGAGLLVATVAIGLAACGSDDDTSASGTTSTSAGAGALEGETAAFCDGVVAFNDAVNAVELDESSTEDDVKATAETLAAPLADITDNAPDGLADTADELTAFVEPMAQGDATAFNTDEAFAAYGAFLTEAVGSCQFTEVPVTAVDYAFEGAPATVAAGTTALTLTNASEGGEDHEMIIMRKADGVDLSWDELLAMSEEESADKVEFKGAGFAAEGAPPGTVLADLDAGEYLMICFLPVGGGEDGAPHFTEGMKQEFTVE
jgi:hypothetical protein